MKLLIIFAVVLAFGTAKIQHYEIELPSYLHICRLNDPDRDACIKESIQTCLTAVRPKTRSSTDLFSLDPFVFESAQFSYQNSALLNGVFSFKDLKTFGMSRGKVQRVKSDFKNGAMLIQAEVFFAKIFATGNYDSNLILSGYNFQSHGQFNLTAKDVKAKWNIKGQTEQVNGEDYMKISRFNILPNIGDMKISASGLFADENLNNIFNSFLNQYWRFFYEDMIKDTRKQWEPIVLKAVNQFFAKIPFRRLLIQD